MRACLSSLWPLQWQHRANRSLRFGQPLPHRSSVCAGEHNKKGFKGHLYSDLRLKRANRGVRRGSC